MNRSELLGGRQLKKEVFRNLSRKDFQRGLDNICRYPVRKIVNPLFSFFCSGDEKIKWRAITAVGAAVSFLAQTNMESARVIMRRLMWTLNDESGGIGWGSPEAMAEIMVRHHQMADEFHHILISYIREDMNYLEHELLQRGVLWGLGRMAYSRPSLIKSAAPFLIPYLRSHDPALRGLAAWTAGPIGQHALRPFLKDLLDDPGTLKIFINMNIYECSVGTIVKNSLSPVNLLIDL